MELDWKAIVVNIEILVHFNGSVFWFCCSDYMIVKSIETKNPR